MHGAPLDHTAEPDRIAVIRFGTTASDVLGMLRG